MYDYAFGYFISSTGAIHCAVYLLLILQLENTLKFIESCDEFIAKSESQSNRIAHFCKLNQLLLFFSFYDAYECVQQLHIKKQWIKSNYSMNILLCMREFHLELLYAYRYFISMSDIIFTAWKRSHFIYSLRFGT